jgi:iron(III) transport system substrate-binding protein
LKLNNPALQAMAGKGFKAENMAASVLANNQTKVQQMLDRVGYK